MIINGLVRRTKEDLCLVQADVMRVADGDKSSDYATIFDAVRLPADLYRLHWPAHILVSFVLGRGDLG